MFRSHSAQFLIEHRKPLAYAFVGAFVLMILGDIQAKMGLTAATSVVVLLGVAGAVGYRLGSHQATDAKQKPKQQTEA